MSKISPGRALCLATGIAMGLSSCTELPNDIGVHHHRSTASQTRLASHHPIPSSWNDAASTKGTPKIIINLTTQQAFFYRGGLLVGRTNISSGRRDFRTPPGSYQVIQKDLHHVSSHYGAYVARSGAIVIRDADVKRSVSQGCPLCRRVDALFFALHWWLRNACGFCPALPGLARLYPHAREHG